ncbi:tetratricopeptide repeat protein [Spirosoma harenae]
MGVFSYYLLKGLKGDADKLLAIHDDTIRAYELDAYLKLNVPMAVRPASQTPRIDGSNQQTIVSFLKPPIKSVTTQNSDQGKGNAQPKANSEAPKQSLNPLRRGSNRSKPLDTPKSISVKLEKPAEQPDTLLNKAKTDTLGLNQLLEIEDEYYTQMGKLQPILLRYLKEDLTLNSAKVDTTQLTTNYLLALAILLKAKARLPESHMEYKETYALQYFLLGLTLSFLGSPLEAVGALDNAIALDSTKAFFFYERGKANWILKRRQESTKDFTQARHLSPTWSFLKADKLAETLRLLDKVKPYAGFSNPANLSIFSMLLLGETNK